MNSPAFLGTTLAWTVESSTRPGKWYLVVKVENGTWYCSCNPFAGLSLSCRHITEVMREREEFSRGFDHGRELIERSGE